MLCLGAGPLLDLPSLVGPGVSRSPFLPYPLPGAGPTDKNTTVYFGYSGHGYSGQSDIVDRWAWTEYFLFILVDFGYSGQVLQI